MVPIFLLLFCYYEVFNINEAGTLILIESVYLFILLFPPQQLVSGIYKRSLVFLDNHNIACHPFNSRIWFWPHVGK